MPNLGVSESEVVTMKITSNANPTGCSHRHITVDKNGQNTVYVFHQSEFAEPVTEREAVLAWIRLRTAEGKSLVNVRIV